MVASIKRTQRHFASDNASGIHPEVMAMLTQVNVGHAVGYGNDDFTQEAYRLFQQKFGDQAKTLLVLTGTGANVIALKSVVASHQAVICSDCAHLHRDECAAPEHFLGGKLLIAPSANGKLTVEAIAPQLADMAMVHRVQPRVVSISQCTEWGTVYSPDEMREIANFCHANNMLLHVDGSRLANAAAALGVDFKAITADVGVDFLSFGGTKNGLLAAEAVVFLNPALADCAPFYQKQAMQLVSKMRFVSAQFIALLENDLWRKNASHANSMASRLEHAVRNIPGVEIVAPVETNVVFAKIPQAWVARLQDYYRFALWDSRTGVVRWMTSFDTTEEDVLDFAAKISFVANECS